MQVPWNETFARQRQKFHFCFTCETCRYYNATGGHCGHEYPNQDHCDARYDSTPPPSAIVFCKEYELA